MPVTAQGGRVRQATAISLATTTATTIATTTIAERTQGVSPFPAGLAPLLQPSHSEGCLACCCRIRSKLNPQHGSGIGWGKKELTDLDSEVNWMDRRFNLSRVRENYSTIREEEERKGWSGGGSPSKSHLSCSVTLRVLLAAREIISGEKPSLSKKYARAYRIIELINH